MEARAALKSQIQLFKPELSLSEIEQIIDMVCALSVPACKAFTGTQDEAAEDE